MQKTQQFFTQIFFPAYEHSVELKEERFRLRQKRISLAEADNARYLKMCAFPDSKKSSNPHCTEADKHLSDQCVGSKLFAD